MTELNGYDDLFSIDDVKKLKKVIKKYKIDVNQGIGKQGVSLFQIVCYTSSTPDIVDYLLENYQIDLFKKDAGGRDSLMYAATNITPLGFLIYRKVKELYIKQLKEKQNKAQPN